MASKNVSGSVLTCKLLLCTNWVQSSSVWSHCHNINKLIILNNNILHIVQNKPLQYRVMNLYKNYNTLPLSTLRNYQLLCPVINRAYYHHNDKMPVIFSNHFLLNNDLYDHHTRSSSLLLLSSVSTFIGTLSIKFKASQLWNTLSEILRKIKNFNFF